VSRGFFDKVYRLVCLVPPGKVATYGQIATLLGHPRAARTVGWALHSLSDEQARVVPWQRVIGVGGRITTSCQTHSAQLQRQLLEEEGIEFDCRGDIEMERFRWEGPDLAELRELLQVEA